MAIPIEDVNGIYLDNEFMDLLFGQIKYEKALGNSQNSQEIKENRENFVKHLISAVNYCTSKICVLKNYEDRQRPYLNWIRWNRPVIEGELMKHEHLVFDLSIKNRISNCAKNVSFVVKKYFTLSESDKAIVNEYNHSLELFTMSHSIKVKFQCARLATNYINLLTKHFYFNQLERSDKSFTDLDTEIDYICVNLEKISFSGRSLADELRRVNETFKNIRKMDEALRIKENGNIEKALNLAHLRAEESIIQIIRRLADEAIQKIENELKKVLAEVWEGKRVYKELFNEPKKFTNGIAYCIRHPIETFKEVVAYFKENPRKAIIMTLGGMTIGLLCGGLVLGAAALVNSLVMFTVPFVALGLVGGLVGAGGAIAIPMAVAGAHANEIKMKAEVEQSRVKRDAEVEVQRLSEVASRMATESILLQEEKRNVYMKAEFEFEGFRKRLDEEARMREQAMQEMEEQLSQMSPKDLQDYKSRLQEQTGTMDDSLEDLKEGIYKERLEIIKEAKDNEDLRKGIKAAENIIKSTCSKTSMIPDPKR